VGVFGGRPVYLRAVAAIVDGAEEASQYVFFGQGSRRREEADSMPGSSVRLLTSAATEEPAVASAAMGWSLAIAFIVTPWAAVRLLRRNQREEALAQTPLKVGRWEKGKVRWSRAALKSHLPTLPLAHLPEKQRLHPPAPASTPRTSSPASTAA
jgi:hypothetical protein